jgi:folate-dependent phosphoribosylglycinamide formyltransferase PurN
MHFLARNDLRGLKNMTLRPKSILFLGYDTNQTRLIRELERVGCSVIHETDKIDSLKGFDLVISFGYRHILTKDQIVEATVPIINLHISYLPWNKGAHPNFWSFWDNTPTGVTIHIIDEGVDTGPILFQKLVNFDLDKETFASSHEKLINEIENLFIDKIHEILMSEYEVYPQRGRGSFHHKKDLPKDFSGWSAVIREEISRLEESRFNPQRSKLDLIDKIEQVRTANNINWMNLLRVVAEVAPERLTEITFKINEQDNLISSYFKQLGE